MSIGRSHLLGNAGFQRYLLRVSYDGSRFPEMATGGTGFGVVDMLYQAITDSLVGRRPNIYADKEVIKLSPSSRTDAGVHALRNALICQVSTEIATLDSSSESKSLYLSKFNRTIDEFCSGSMKVLDFHQVALGFCVRRHVSYRRYTYRLAVCRDWQLWESLKESPSTVCFSEKNYAWRLPPGFSPEKASDVCKVFEGRHVMGSFFKHTNRDKRTDPHPRSAIRNVLLCQITKGEHYSVSNNIYEYYNVTVIARSFVREQIRRMISCLVFHSYDRLPMRTILWLLQNPISSNFYDIRIPVAPPNGLFLTDVVYPPEMFTRPFPYYHHYWDNSEEKSHDLEDCDVL